jgi:opacity protein-like surface antigen
MKRVLLSALLFLTLQASAWAADFTLYAGMQKQEKFTFTSVGTAESAATQIIKDPFSSGNFGIRISGGNVLGHEQTIAYTPNFIDSNTKALILSSNILITIPLPVVKPYMTAGLGTFVVHGVGVTDFGAKFAYNYGGGVKILPAGPIGVRADIRGYTLTGVQSQKLNVFEVSLGVLFHF